ncbi:hypothetical protein RB195_009985 [Necator americanus]|uniref:Uncharacterized protein n=1 Tax=Necator americanus TaxID=51031 RepID=A0ABR1CVT4_NECAM
MPPHLKRSIRSRRLGYDNSCDFTSKSLDVHECVCRVYNDLLEEIANVEGGSTAIHSPLNCVLNILIKVSFICVGTPMRRGGAPLHHGASVPTSLGLAFPACVTEALLQVSKHIRLSSHGRGRPSLTKNNDLQLLIDNEVFCLGADRKSTRLSQLQEFTLINLLAHFFTERDEMNKYTYFEVLFLGREGDSHIHEQRLRLLYRLASYALQFPVLQLYAQISLWLSKVGNSKPYAEELVAVLAEHYLKPADSIIYEYLLPLESSCPEFTVFFVVYATRFMPINRPMAAVFASYINRNPGYFLKGFRDSPHLADIFRLEVFEKMLNYLLEIEGEPSSDIEAMNYHTAVMVLLDKWSSTIKKPLDINLLFDPSIRWSRFRSDALCVVGSKSPAAGKMVAKKLEGCKIPPAYAALISDAQTRSTTCA